MVDHIPWPPVHLARQRPSRSSTGDLEGHQTGHRWQCPPTERSCWGVRRPGNPPSTTDSHLHVDDRNRDAEQSAPGTAAHVQELLLELASCPQKSAPNVRAAETGSLPRYWLLVEDSDCKDLDERVQIAAQWCPDLYCKHQNTPSEVNSVEVGEEVPDILLARGCSCHLHLRGKCSKASIKLLVQPAKKANTTSLMVIGCLGNTIEEVIQPLMDNNFASQIHRAKVVKRRPEVTAPSRCSILIPKKHWLKSMTLKMPEPCQGPTPHHLL